MEKVSAPSDCFTLMRYLGLSIGVLSPAPMRRASLSQLESQRQKAAAAPAMAAYDLRRGWDDGIFQIWKLVPSVAPRGIWRKD